MFDSGGDVMTEKRTMPVRLDVESIREAKLAAATKGLSLTEYASIVLMEAAQRDNDAWAKARGTRRTRRGKADEAEGAGK